MKAHLDHLSKPDALSWLKLDEHLKIDHLAQKGVTLVGLDDAIRYGWVEPEVACTSSILNTKAAIKATSLVVGDPREW